MGEYCDEVWPSKTPLKGWGLWRLLRYSSHVFQASPNHWKPHPGKSRRQTGIVFHEYKRYERTAGIAAVQRQRLTVENFLHGGTKCSGIGGEGGRSGIEEFLETKSIPISLMLKLSL